jgi:predicted metal-binding membrane protein
VDVTEARRPSRSGPDVATVLVAVLAALAWLSLWAWDRSPYARYLSHAELRHATGASETMLFVAGWTLMTVAMMLPTSLPLVSMFDRLTARRSDRALLMALLVTGYLATWSIFGVAVHGLDRVVHGVVHRAGWLEANGWVIGTATLVGAGLYQFSSLKYRCLDKCRSPLMFVNEHWRGRDERRQSLLLGIRHGAFCVGCCWALMLLMFAVGVGNLGWMFGLGALMAAEKNLPSARGLSKPLGVALVMWALASAAVAMAA